MPALRRALQPSIVDGTQSHTATPVLVSYRTSVRERMMKFITGKPPYDTKGEPLLQFWCPWFWIDTPPGLNGIPMLQRGDARASTLWGITLRQPGGRQIALMGLARTTTLDEIRARANAELRINPTITVYTFTNGVEHRRAANSWAGINAGLKGIEVSFRELGKAAEAFRTAIENGQSETLK